jgi:hypothetical protein
MVGARPRDVAEALEAVGLAEEVADLAIERQGFLIGVGDRRTGRATAAVDPELPFEVGPRNGREARESGLRLNS